MKIKIKRKPLLESLQYLETIATNGLTLPIIENVLIRIKDKKNFIATAFNLEVSSVKRILLEEEVEEDVQFCVEPRSISRIIKTIDDEDIVLDLSEDSVNLIYNAGNAMFPVIDAKDYPKIDIPTYGNTIKFPAPLLKAWISEAADFVATDNNVPVLSCMRFCCKDGYFSIAASDRFKCYYDKELVDGILDCSEGIIRKDSVRKVAQAINSCGKDDMVTIGVSDKNVTFKAKDFRVTCLVTVGKFPNIEDIISKVDMSYATKVVIDKNALSSSVDRANLASSLVNKIELTASDNVLLVNSEDIMSKKSVKESIECEIEGVGNSIAVKGVYVSSCLKSVADDKVTINIKDEMSMLVLTDAERPNKRLLVAPIKK